MVNEVPAPTGTTDGVNASWRDNLPTDLKAEKTLEKFVGKDWSEAGPTLAKSYVALEKMPRGVTVPGEKATPEEWDAFHTKMGRPADIAQYGVKAVVPDGLLWSEEAEKLVVGNMHKLGLSQKQAQGVIDSYLKLAHEGVLKVEQAKNSDHDTAVTEMKGEWGGLYDENIALVQRIVTEFGDEDFKTYLDETGLGNDPRFLKFAYNIGRPMLEDNLVRGDGLGMKRADAQAELDTIMKTKEYMNGDKAMLARVATLYPIAHGE